MKRKDFLKLVGIGAGTALIAKTAKAESNGKPPKGHEFVGVLQDTTRCIGCRSCEVACARENNLPVPDIKDNSLFKNERTTGVKQLTVVNRYETSRGTVYVKKQCMHCWQAACASACLTEAMYKTKDGPIIWRENKCMGCRFCMVSCPFVIPKFEYNSANPRIHKCTMCWSRLQKGQQPACVEACPTESLVFGTKRNIMGIARTRIYGRPRKYIPHIYGEYEVGGTGWLYISGVPFEEIGFRTDLGTTPVPEYTREFLYAVPGVFLMVPSLLTGLHLLTSRIKKSNPLEKETENHEVKKSEKL